MSTINDPNYNVDLTVRVFDDFYGFESVVPVNEWDAVSTYFESIYTTKAAAKNGCANVDDLCQISNITSRSVSLCFLIIDFYKS